MLVLIGLFGVLVVTGTPVHRIGDRIAEVRYYIDRARGILPVEDGSEFEDRAGVTRIGGRKGNEAIEVGEHTRPYDTPVLGGLVPRAGARGAGARGAVGGGRAGRAGAAGAVGAAGAGGDGCRSGQRWSGRCLRVLAWAGLAWAVPVWTGRPGRGWPGRCWSGRGQDNAGPGGLDGLGLGRRRGGRAAGAGSGPGGGDGFGSRPGRNTDDEVIAEALAFGTTGDDGHLAGFSPGSGSATGAEADWHRSWFGTGTAGDGPLRDGAGSAGLVPAGLVLAGPVLAGPTQAGRMGWRVPG